MSPSDDFDLDAYLARVAWRGPVAADLETLRELHAAHASRIPFENLDVRLGRPVGLDLASLQEKLVRTEVFGLDVPEENVRRALAG